MLYGEHIKMEWVKKRQGSIERWKIAVDQDTMLFLFVSFGELGNFT